jgi:hypothetical protein
MISSESRASTDRVLHIFKSKIKVQKQIRDAKCKFSVMTNICSETKIHDWNLQPM